MHFVLNAISVVATFIVFSGLIYFVLNIAVGQLAFFNQYISNSYKIKLKHLIFHTIATILLLTFTTFYKPWWKSDCRQKYCWQVGLDERTISSNSLLYFIPAWREVIHQTINCQLQLLIFIRLRLWVDTATNIPPAAILGR